MRAVHPFLKCTASFFLLLCILFIPFPFYVFPFQIQITDFVFGKLIKIAAAALFGTELKNSKVYSDSSSMYVLMLILFITSILLSLLFIQWKKLKAYQTLFFKSCYNIGCYYLVLQLLKYGVGKITKEQFYLPEPNTLFTPLGRLSKDILYWSSMGTSHFYNVFTGSIEVFTALLILFKRTRLLGLLLSLLALLQIVAINFSFDISVKLYSLLLLFINIYLLFPFCSRLYNFFWLNENVVTVSNTQQTILRSNNFIMLIGKSLAIALIFTEVFYPVLKSNNLNDDLSPRPFLHGAYEVQQVIADSDTLIASTYPFKRFFIHRKGYIIFQSINDEMQDFKLTNDEKQHELTLTDYQLNTTRIKYTNQASDSLLLLQYFKEGKEFKIVSKSLNWRNLPALQKSFHWTVDEE